MDAPNCVFKCGGRGRNLPCKQGCKTDDEHVENCKMARRCLEHDLEYWVGLADQERRRLSSHDKKELVDRRPIHKHSKKPRYCAPEDEWQSLATADDVMGVGKVVELYERAFRHEVSWDYNGKYGRALKGKIWQWIELDNEREKVQLVGAAYEHKLEQLKKDILG